MLFGSIAFAGAACGSRRDTILEKIRLNWKCGLYTGGSKPEQEKCEFSFVFIVVGPLKNSFEVRWNSPRFQRNAYFLACVTRVHSLVWPFFCALNGLPVLVHEERNFAELFIVFSFSSTVWKEADDRETLKQTRQTRQFYRRRRL